MLFSLELLVVSRWCPWTLHQYPLSENIETVPPSECTCSNIKTESFSWINFWTTSKSINEYVLPQRLWFFDHFFFLLIEHKFANPVRQDWYHKLPPSEARVRGEKNPHCRSLFFGRRYFGAESSEWYFWKLTQSQYWGHCVLEFITDLSKSVWWSQDRVSQNCTF